MNKRYSLTIYYTSLLGRVSGDTSITSKNIASSEATVSTIEQQSSINIDNSPSSSSSSSPSIIIDDDINEYSTKNYPIHNVESLSTGHLSTESTSSLSSSLLSSSSSSSPLLSTTSSKTSLSIDKHGDIENNESIERSRSIAKNLVSIPTKTQQSIRRNKITSRTLVALSSNKNENKLLHSSSIDKRSNIGKAVFLAASRLVGSKDAT
ncbi:hypothetical protein PV328_012106 [Microctonus aethiopoides]|uniref:Uncharacterized protein n=1 Tax=Microctonus aethiopoides TaxID=144406 RepID=A0AA39ERX7_9HYME|nr:hypothetical protein PV328_012106 [Microctonus aethiopoides]